MLPATVWDYRRIGTPENILLRAGFVSATPTDEGVGVEAGPELPSLFAPAAVPTLKSILPHLLNIVIAEAFDRSGFLTSSDLRIHAVGMLQQAGMKISSAGAITEKIRNAADESKAELIKTRRAWF